MPDDPDDPAAPRQDGVATAWHVILGLDLGFLGLNIIATIFIVLFSDADLSLSYAEQWGGVVMTFLLFGVIPFLWVVFTRVGGFQGALLYLRMRDPGRGVLEGIVAAVALLGLVLGVFGAAAALGYEPDTSDVTTGILETLDWPLAIALALGAGLGEEILFRGILQRWIGVWGQGILFGLAHAGYDSVPQVVVPLAIGIGFGYLFKWRRNLWTLVVAHFLYDLVLLGSALIWPDSI